MSSAAESMAPSAVLDCPITIGRKGHGMPEDANQELKDCTKCEGRGKYADPRKGPLVAVTCDRCEGSGKVPQDWEDVPPMKEPTRARFGQDPRP